jgi:lipid II:glycine glycyltransferase (peptidoglycan interpeptide bridge formation enzyme)
MNVYIDSVGHTEWKRNSKYFMDYSIYQTWEYQQVRAARAGQQLSRILIIGDDGLPVLMGQVRIKRIPMLRLTVGYIQSGPLVQVTAYHESSVLQALIQLRQSFVCSRVNVLRLKPNIENDNHGKRWSNLFCSAGFQQVKSEPPYHTMIVSLADSPEQILSRMDREARRIIRRAEQRNTDFREGTNEEFFDILKGLYTQAKERKGFRGIDADDFAESQKLFAEEDKIRVLIAYDGNKPVSAHATAHVGIVGEPLIAANTPDGLKCGSSYLIWWRAYLRAKELGMRYYNLGGIDEKLNPNGYRFKKRMGGIEVFHIGEFEASTNCAVRFEWRCIEKLYRLVRRVL